VQSLTGEFKKLDNGELHNSYSSSNIIRQNISRKMWHVACTRDERKVYRSLVGKHEEKRPLARPRHRYEDGIRMDLREIG
jgi:hypothetical protein